MTADQAQTAKFLMILLLRAYSIFPLYSVVPSGYRSAQTPGGRALGSCFSGGRASSTPRQGIDEDHLRESHHILSSLTPTFVHSVFMFHGPHIRQTQAHGAPGGAKKEVIGSASVGLGNLPGGNAHTHTHTHICPLRMEDRL